MLWNNKKYCVHFELVRSMKFFISYNWICVFSYTKNRRGMAGSGKAVSRIVGFLTFTGAYWWEMWYYSVQNSTSEYLTTKIPSLLYSSL